MALSQDIVSQFAKLTVQPKEDKGTEVKGTYKLINNVEYVQLDGSDVLTPVKSTVVAETGEKVNVLIKDHMATVIENITSPSARSKDVSDLADIVDEQGNTIQQMDNTIIQQGNSIIQMNNTINQQQTTINQHDTKINQQGDKIVSLNNTIVSQGNQISLMNNTIIQQGDNINSMNNTIIQQGNNINSMNNVIQQHNNRITQNSNEIIQTGNTIRQHGNQITQMNSKIDQQDDVITSQGNNITMLGNIITAQGNIIDLQNNVLIAHGNSITILNSGFSIIDGVLTGLSAAVIESLKATTLDVDYAQIDFANIDIAAVRKVFADSGIIKDIVIQEGRITGELVGVTIKGDLIQAGTLMADRLVVKGSDGLYYTLNLNGLNNISISESSKFDLLEEEPEDWNDKYKNYYRIVNNKYTHITDNVAPTWAANTYYKLSSEYESALDGTNIVAKSVTADKVSVNDLVAFDATIGGYVIENNSLHTVGKQSADSNVRGIYLDNTGQINIGDGSSYLRFLIDQTTGDSSLEISLDDFYLGTKGKYISEELDDIRDNITNLDYDSGNLVSNYVDPDPTKSKWIVGEYVPGYDPIEPEMIEDTEGKLRYSVAIPVFEGEKYQIQIYGSDIVEVLMTIYGDNPETGESLYKDYIDGLGHEDTEWICPSDINRIRITLYSTDPTNYGLSLSDIDTNIRIKISNSDKTSEFSYSYDDINTKMKNTKQEWEKDFEDNYKNKYDKASSDASNALSSFETLDADYRQKIASYEDPETGKFIEFANGISKNKQAIELMASLIGGNNLLRNSVGFNGVESWLVTNQANISTTQEASLENETISHSAFILEGNSSLSQTINVEKDTYYNISSRIKHIKASGATDLSPIHLYIRTGENDNVEVLQEDNDYKGTTEYLDFHKFQYVDINTGNEDRITVTIQNTGNDKMIISDLMLAIGTISMVWSQHKEEIYGKTVKLDIDGLKVYPKDSETGEVIKEKYSSVTDNGFKTEVIRPGESMPIATSFLNEQGMKTENTYTIKTAYLGDGTTCTESDYVLKTTTILVTDGDETHIDIIEY